jgi:hypothetical protein
MPFSIPQKPRHANYSNGYLVKRSTILLLVIVAVIVGVILWFVKRGKSAPPAVEAATAQKAADEPEGPHVARDTNGNVVISMTDEAQGEMGIKVKKPEPRQMSPEVKGYGRAQDPAPLAASLADLAAAEAVFLASSNELARSKILQGQGNASARVLQTAEAASTRDRLAFQTSRDKLLLAWGNVLAGQTNLPGFVQALTSREAVLVRIDLPAGEIISNAPSAARVVALSGRSAEGQFLGSTPAVDPQAQGQGFFFLIKPNATQLSPGEAVTAFLKLPGEPVAGVIIPREAVVRAEGSGWVYSMKSDGEGLTRTEIPLDHPVDEGWFITKGVTADNYIVTTGAQQLLSIELKGKGD